MPIIFELQDLHVTEKNEAKVVTLANQAMLGTNALQVEKVLIPPGAESDSYPPSEAERFVYVIRGNGQAYVGQRVFPLNIESVLWLEKEDTFYIEAGFDGLEVLLCQAPASE